MSLLRFDKEHNVAHYCEREGEAYATRCSRTFPAQRIVRHDHNTRVCKDCERKEAEPYRR